MIWKQELDFFLSGNCQFICTRNKVINIYK